MGEFRLNIGKTRRGGPRRRKLALGALLVAAGCALASPAATAGDAKETQITINFVETHDRLDPDPRPGITRSATIEATLSGNGQIHENNADYIKGNAKRNKPGNGMRQGENDEKLGDTATRVVWRVDGPHKLQRLLVGKQFIMVAEIEVVQDASCSVEIKYLLQKGYTDVVMRRRDNGELAKFSLPKVLNSSCSIR